MVLPADLGQMQRVVEQTLAEPGTRRNRLRIRRRDGEVRVLDVTLRAEFWPDGRPRRLVGTSLDVTELARAQEELEQANRQLQEKERTKERLVDAVSHDLRTPLSAIVGYAEFLLDELDGPLSPGQRESVTVIDRAAKRLTRLADDLLDFARLRQGPLPAERRVVSLDAMVAEELALLQPMAQERQVTLVLHVAAAPATLEADATRLGRALSNLITNAIKFTLAGGEVAVHVAPVAAGLRVEVRDSGVGIPQDQLGRVFEPFVQAGPPKGGAGLGLAIARAIVEAHGGRIGVTSHEGQGSTFWLELPAMVPTKAV
jgi:signal transduction histidine kinase